MLELTTTRANPMIDPALHVWGWEIPVYLFLGGVVAGMMVLAGVAMIRVARGEDPKGFFSVQTPILAIALISLGMGALFLDLEHKLFVWRVYTAFEPTSPMSWGSWVLLLVYPALAAAALVRLPEAWPWLARTVPALERASAALLSRPGRIGALGWLNVVLGVGLGIYTGILLSTMIARPLWNSAILGPLFLVSGLSAAAATVHLVSVLVPGRRPAPQGMVGGAISALVQPLGPAHPDTGKADALIRADIGFLLAELVLIALLLIGLASSSAAHVEGARLLLSGRYAAVFWVVVVAVGILVPLGLQALEVRHRIRHTVLPALLVLAGGLALRWVMVSAGQASHFVQSAGM